MNWPAARAAGAAHQFAPAGGRAAYRRKVANNPNRARELNMELKVTFRARD